MFLSIMFDPIESAIESFKNGEMIIVVDDVDRENEGDLVFAAEFATPEKLAFMIRHTGGVVCLALSNDIADRLDLPPMVARNTSKLRTPYTVSIDAAEGIESGISAADRAATVQKAIHPHTKPNDIARPGHIFPLRAADGGVLWRAGHTEASVDMCRIAGLSKGAVLSELMHEDGSMMRLPALEIFAKEHALAIISIADLIAYRRKHESFISLLASTNLDTKTGMWELRVYQDLLHNQEQIALVKGDVLHANKPVLVRVHSECATGDIFGSKQCDCGEQLERAMGHIAEEGLGVVIYMKQEGRGIGLIKKIQAYDLQKKNGLDTVEANRALGLPEDLREYGIGAQILSHIGVKEIRLMTNNPKKLVGIDGYGFTVVEQVPIEVKANGVNDGYLKTKKEKMGHLLQL